MQSYRTQVQDNLPTVLGAGINRILISMGTMVLLCNSEETERVGRHSSPKGHYASNERNVQGHIVSLRARLVF